jgi:gamma-glutamyltranspeptidase/glutathione hydrolase
LISATLSPIAVRAGLEALAAGGTAADAAIAVAMTQVVTIAGAVVSFAGVLQAVYFDAASGQVFCLDADWNTYREERDRTTIPPVNLGSITGATDVPVDHSSDGRRTLVPGFMAGLGALSRRFGDLPFKELVQPALWYAENGVPVGPLLASYFDRRREVLARTEAGRRFLAGAGRDCPVPGDRFRQPELAILLKAVARHGPRAMYSGLWADQFVATVREAGGNATSADLTGYRARWKRPASTGFGGAIVYGPPAKNPMAYSVLLALNLLDASGAAREGYWRDPEAFACYVRALRFGQMGRYLPQVGAFEAERRLVSQPEDRLTPEYARAVAPHITALLGGQAAASPAGSHSDSVVVVDRFGNVAALVHTGNSILWNETGLVVQGVPLPEPTVVNQTRFSVDPPGSRVHGMMTPMIALRGGHPAAAVASIGSSLMGETTRLMAGLLASEPNDLVALALAPPFLINTGPFGTSFSLADLPEAVPESGYDADFLAAASALGLVLRPEPPQRVATLRGTAAFATIGTTVTAAEAPALFVHVGTD